jgi:tetratricopeptide (TPR) repeat protein
VGLFLAGPLVFPLAADTLADRPVEKWTEAFTALVAGENWRALDRELSLLRTRHAEVDPAFGLGYLHARAKIEVGDLAGARGALEPYLAPKHPLRDLALYHRYRIAEALGDKEQARRDLEELVLGFPKATYRGRAIEALMARYKGESARLIFLADRLAGTVSTSTRRALEARIVQALLVEDRREEAATRGLRLLREQGGDDAAEAVTTALDRPEILDRMTPADWMTVGEALRAQRHFEPAIRVLKRALSGLPLQRDELGFAIGRAHFGLEQFAAAEEGYVKAAKATQDAEARGALFYHAARCAELQGDDKRAERLLGDAIRSGPWRQARKRRRARLSVFASSNPRVALALLARLRLRLAAGRMGDAGADLEVLKTRFPETESARDGALAYAIAQIAAGREASARTALERFPRARLASAELAEIDYWSGRALETVDPGAAVVAFRGVLETAGRSPFARLARRQLAGPLKAGARREVERLEAELGRLLNADDLEGARRAQTGVALLSPDEDRPAALAGLRDLYAELPAYREIVELRPLPFPRLPLPEDQRLTVDPAAWNNRSRGSLLLSLGLFDEAADVIGDVYPSGAAAFGLTRAEALLRGGALRRSIAAVEGAVGALPSGYLPELLPPRVRELLHPVHHREIVEAEARANRVEVPLVLAIIREESRFDARARSGAGARGVLQLVLPTARAGALSLGVSDLSAEDLYQPEVSLALGTRYLAELLGQHDGDVYKTLAAYNAGPRQAALWSRRAPGRGQDVFLSSITFDETRTYVNRVAASYEAYRALWGKP